MWTVKYISFGKQPVAARPQGSGLAKYKTTVSAKTLNWQRKENYQWGK